MIQNLASCSADESREESSFRFKINIHGTIIEKGLGIMRRAALIDIVRTPFGKGREGGALSSEHPVDL